MLKPVLKYVLHSSLPHDDSPHENMLDRSTEMTTRGNDFINANITFCHCHEQVILYKLLETIRGEN